MKRTGNTLAIRSQAGRLLCIALAVLVIGCMLRATPAQAQEEDGGKRVGVPHGVYDKPYIARLGRGTVLGGYVDMEFQADFDDGFENTATTFDQHRLIPFIFSEITDRLHFATEIEFEHGGNPDEGGEIKLEYAALDFTLRPWLVFRGGILLSPLGYFNLVHDSPWNDLTARPLVNQQIIPTTLSEAGMGVQGTLYPGALSIVHYEMYLVNGFNEEILQGSDDVTTPARVRLRSGRGSVEEDNNRNKALVGRVSWSPKLGVQVGGSFHTGTYDDAGEDRLTVLAADLEYNRGAFQVLGEYAYARIGLDRFDLDTQAQHGFYLQGNYHLIADRLLAGSVFTLVTRYDYLDFGLSGDLEDVRQDRLTLGVNFRPVEDAVFKLDWGFNWETPPKEDRSFTGSTLFFSFATYF